MSRVRRRIFTFPGDSRMADCKGRLPIHRRAPLGIEDGVNLLVMTVLLKLRLSRLERFRIHTDESYY